MKTFKTLKKGDKIIMEHASFVMPCNETINGTTYLSKIETKDVNVSVIGIPDRREDVTDEMVKKYRMIHSIFVTDFGRIDIPFDYIDKDFCPNQKNGATARIVQ